MRGRLPDGTPYSAHDQDLLAWVHVTETYCFLEAWKRYAEPAMPSAEQDRYFREMRELAARLGVDDVPVTTSGTIAYLRASRPQLETSERTREIVKVLLNPPVQGTAVLPLQSMTAQAAIDLLPPWARRMHGLHSSKFSRPMIHGGTVGLAGLLRWAFR